MFVKRREHKSQKCHHPIPSGRIARRAELNIVRQGLVICSFPARPQPSIYLQRYSTVGKAFKLFNCCQMISNVSAPQMQSPETPQNRRNQSNQGNDTPGSLRSKIITKQPKVARTATRKTPRILIWIPVNQSSPATVWCQLICKLQQKLEMAFCFEPPRCNKRWTL